MIVLELGNPSQGDNLSARHDRVILRHPQMHEAGPSSSQDSHVSSALVQLSTSGLARGAIAEEHLKSDWNLKSVNPTNTEAERGAKNIHSLKALGIVGEAQPIEKYRQLGCVRKVLPGGSVQSTKRQTYSMQIEPMERCSIYNGIHSRTKMRGLPRDR